jgi:uncharacterized protein YecT (DUF1311 family)
MSMQKITIGLLTLCSLNVIAADVNNKKTAKHIDAQLKTCIASAPNAKPVVKILECIAENTELWNAEISARLEQRKAKQNDAQNLVLEKAQSDWETYRDTQFRSFESDIASDPTSQKIIDLSEDELALIKKRALEL